MKTRKIPRWVLIYIVVCMLINLFPNYGAPNFRYSGSDPAVNVWNFGWPFASLIYDFRSGFHVGPGVVLIVLAQSLILGVLGAIITVVRKLLPNKLFNPDAQKRRAG